MSRLAQSNLPAFACWLTQLHNQYPRFMKGLTGDDESITGRLIHGIERHQCEKSANTV
jgi:hypothetical protein